MPEQPSGTYDTDRIRRHVMSNDEAVPDAIALREALLRLGERRV